MSGDADQFSDWLRETDEVLEALTDHMTDSDDD